MTFPAALYDRSNYKPANMIDSVTNGTLIDRIVSSLYTFINRAELRPLHSLTFSPDTKSHMKYNVFMTSNNVWRHRILK